MWCGALKAIQNQRNSLSCKSRFSVILYCSKDTTLLLILKIHGFIYNKNNQCSVKDPVSLLTFRFNRNTYIQ